MDRSFISKNAVFIKIWHTMTFSRNASRQHGGTVQENITSVMGLEAKFQMKVYLSGVGPRTVSPGHWVIL